MNARFDAFFFVSYEYYFIAVKRPNHKRKIFCVANRPKIRPNNSKQPELKTSGPRKIWAEFPNFPSNCRKQPKLSNFCPNIHYYQQRLNKSVRVSYFLMKNQQWLRYYDGHHLFNIELGWANIRLDWIKL